MPLITASFALKIASLYISRVVSELRLQASQLPRDKGIIPAYLVTLAGPKPRLKIAAKVVSLVQICKVRSARSLKRSA